LDRPGAAPYTGVFAARAFTLSTRDADTSQNDIEALKAFLGEQPDVEFAVLVGSRADGTATSASDWDIALQLRREGRSYMSELARMEALRHDIGALLETEPDRIDLISAPSAKLAMRDLVANHGTALTDPTSLPWLHFLQRSCRVLEDYYRDDLDGHR